MPSDDRYPELLIELREQLVVLFQKHGQAHDDACALAQAATERVREHLGGQLIYFPKGLAYETRRMYEEVWRDFNGKNHADLARKYKRSTMQIYRIVAIMKAEQARLTQGSLL